MQRQFLATIPGVADDGGMRHVDDLFDDIEFAHDVVPQVRGRVLQQIRMPVAHVLHMAQPVVDQADANIFQCGVHATAAVMPNDDHMLHLETFDGELDRRQGVQIGMHHDVGNIAMDKHLTWLQSGDLVRRHPAVGTADPHVFGLLLRHQFGEKTWSFRLHTGGPCVRLCTRPKVGYVVKRSSACGAAAVCPARWTSDCARVDDLRKRMKRIAQEVSA